ncbi:MAG: class I SAM-dependent methyltransferase [Desulfovibrio sp.]|uniref:class I SAM-dependent methyltransferase n=1 Tax=Desulfovibrio sp. TaxID=885 RepID=UPI002583B578|nr:class I SAM-dependent methyltransferase [Desulfovibrio sp.]MCD7984163.1 class I SAM-dependent methyltransferase [Desulfovibrio sp.]
MEFTGERFVPSCQGEIAAEHYHRYFFAAGLVSGKHVLDIASGEGYGTHILAQSAARAAGVDTSPEAVASATKNYAGENISFLEGSAVAIPLPDASVDVVVSFETLEHLHEQEKMLQEIRRVLRNDGFLIISTPNKPVYNNLISDNEFHVKELCREEFITLLEEQFINITVLSQKVMFGSLLAGASNGLSLLHQHEESVSIDCLPFLDQGMYFIAIASNGKLPPVTASFFEYPLEKSYMAAKFRQELAELQERHYETEERLKTVEAAYASLLASSSWRLTAPLRRLRRMLRGSLAAK